MTDDFQFQPQNEERSGTNPLVFVALGVVVLGAGAWYFLQQPGSAPAPESLPPAAVSTAPTAPPAAAPVPVAAPVTSGMATGSFSGGGSLIAITQPTVALKQAQEASGRKDDPFRNEANRVVAPVIQPKPVPKLPAIPSPPVAKQFVARTIAVIGIVDTPKENYAILSVEGRNEIARVGDSFQTAMVQSISAQTRTVVFREQGEEITRALEVSQ